MASFDAGSIEARLELNRDAFRAGIEQAKAEGHELEDQKFDAKAGLDPGQLQAEIDRSREELDRLQADRANVPIGGDTSDLDRKIDEAKAKLDELKRKEAEVGETGRAEFGKAAESLGKLHESADLIAGKLDEIKGRAVGALDVMKGKADEAGGAMERTKRSTDSLGQSILSLGPKLDSALRGIPTLLAFGPLLAGAALPAIAAVTAGALGMAGALTVAGAGFGALGLLASPILSSISSDMKTITPLFEKWKQAQPGPEQVAAWNNIEAAVKKLPPGEREVVQGVIDLKAQLFGLSAAIRPDLLDAFQKFLGAAHTLLPQLVPLAQETAKALGDLGGGLQRDFTSPGFHAFMNFLTGNARIVIDQLGKSINNLASGFGHLLMDTEPLMHDFLNGLVSITGKFNEWAQGRGQQQLQTFMNWVHDNGPMLKQTLEDMATAIGHVVRDLGGFAGVDLRILDDLAKAINAIAQAPGGAVALEITALALALGKIAGVLRLGTIIGDLFRLADAVKAFRGAEGLMASIGAFAKTISGAETGKAEGGAVKAGEKDATQTAKGTGEAVGGGFLAGLLGKLKGGAGFISAWMSLYVLEPIAAAVTSIPGLIAAAAAAIAVGLAAIIAPIVAWGKNAGTVISEAARQALGSFGKALGPIWGDIENAIGTGFGVLSRFFTQTITRWMSTASRDFSGALGAIGRFFSQTIPNAITSAAGAVGRAVARYGEAIGNAFGHFGILVGQGAQIIGRFFSQTIPNAVTAAAGAVGRAVERYGEAIGNALGHFGSLVGQALGIIGRFFSETLPGAISGAAGAVGRAAQTVVQAIGTGATQAWGAVSNFFSSTIPSAIKNAFSTAGSWLLGAGHDIISGLQSAASSAWSAVSGFFSNTVPGAIKGFFSGAGSWLLGAGHDIISGLGTAATNAWGAASSAFSSVKGKVTGFFSDAIGWLSSAGHDIVQGLANGIKGAGNLIDDAASWVKGKVNAIVNFFTGSPSPQFIYLGRMLMEGLTLGIVGSSGRVDQALSMVRDILSSFSGVLGAVLGPQLSVGGARVGGPVSTTYAPSNSIHVAGDLTREAVSPLLAGLDALHQRDGAVLTDLAARGVRFANAIPGMT